MSTHDAQGWVSAETTLPVVPLPPIAERRPVRTERLLIRPIREDDLMPFHELRAQPEVMANTAKGCIDYSIEETREEMRRNHLPPNEDRHFLFGIFLASSGELIGCGGVHTLESALAGWPEVGYLFKKEHWGKGYATEFLRGFLGAWWSLPRSTRKLRVIRSSVEGEGEMTERVYADMLKDNFGSQRVLEKVGFKRFREWTEPDKRAGKNGELVGLAGYYLLREGPEVVAN